MWLQCFSIVKFLTKWQCHVNWFGWMKSSCKLHLYVTTIATWYHVSSFATKILYHLFKATNDVTTCMW